MYAKTVVNYFHFGIRTKSSLMRTSASLRGMMTANFLAKIDCSNLKNLFTSLCFSNNVILRWESIICRVTWNFRFVRNLMLVIKPWLYSNLIFMRLIVFVTHFQFFSSWIFFCATMHAVLDRLTSRFLQYLNINIVIVLYWYL